MKLVVTEVHISIREGKTTYDVAGVIRMSRQDRRNGARMLDDDRCRPGYAYKLKIPGRWRRLKVRLQEITMPDATWRGIDDPTAIRLYTIPKGAQ